MNYQERKAQKEHRDRQLLESQRAYEAGIEKDKAEKKARRSARRKYLREHPEEANPVVSFDVHEFVKSMGSPPPRAPRPVLVPCLRALGILPPTNEEAVRRAFRRLAREAHPDTGGSHEEFVALNKAYQEALMWCKWHPSR